MSSHNLCSRIVTTYLVRWSEASGGLIVPWNPWALMEVAPIIRLLPAEILYRVFFLLPTRDLLSGVGVQEVEGGGRGTKALAAALSHYKRRIPR